MGIERGDHAPNERERDRRADHETDLSIDPDYDRLSYQ